MVHAAAKNQTTEFSAAFDQYLAGLQDPSEKEFVELCRRRGEAGSAQVFNDLLHAKHTSAAPTSRLYDIFGRIADGLKDYGEVIDNLVSAYPLPLAIVWGSIRVVVEGVTRCRNLFELFEDQFQKLAIHIEQIREFKELFGEFPAMQKLFLRSYIDMFRFWHGAFQACKTKGLHRALKSLLPAPLEKLQSVVDDIEKDVKNIRQEAKMCLTRLHQREQQYANGERAAQSLFRTHQMAVNSQNLCMLIRKHLKCTRVNKTGVDDQNDTFYEKTLKPTREDFEFFQVSCSWLACDQTFVTWTTKPSPPPYVLCLEGPSGSGKTVLTSYAVNHLRSSMRVAAVYFFCQFSQNFSKSVDPFKLIACQLFEIYYSRGYPVSEFLSDQILHCTSCDEFQTLIRGLVDDLGGAFFFIDGLDEATDTPASHYASSIVDFLEQLCKDTDGRARLWCSFASALRPLSYYDKIAAACKGKLAIDLATRSEPRIHVAELIRTQLRKFGNDLAGFQDGASDDASTPQLGGLSDSDTDAIRCAEESLVEEAEGNFLWAHLMTATLFKDGIRTVEALKEHATPTHDPKRVRLPSQYDKIYANHFQLRISKSDRVIAGKVMALVAYSRRHLCAGELREAAMTLVMKHNKKDKKLLERPGPEAFLRCFSVHVNIDRGKDGVIGWSSICRLDHASVRDFLLAHPSPWDDDVEITPAIVIDACLSYIERPVYRSPLQRLEDPGKPFAWIDAHGKAMNEGAHHFIQYAIKYWARHLEDPRIKDETSLRTRAEAFVRSPNFQTLLQMQTLWVEGQFCVYAVAGRPSVLRVLPDWMIESSRQVTPLWKDYMVLHHNWARVLNCADCRDADDFCPIRAHRGEIDRVWWGSLGQAHAFSTFKSRYPNYRLERPLPNVTVVPGNRFESLVIHNGFIHILQYTSKATFLCQRWSITNYASAPQLVSEQRLVTSALSTNWALYTSTRAGTELRANPTAFDADGRVLRIGSQLFCMNPGSQTYQPLYVVSGSQPTFPSIVDDITSRGRILAVGSRQHSVVSRVLADTVIPGTLDLDLRRFESLAGRKRWSLDEDSSSGYETSSTSSSSRDWEGVESWSEGSTEDDDDGVVSDTDSSDSSQDLGPPPEGLNLHSDSSESSPNGSDGELAGDISESESDSDGSSSPSSVDPTTMPQFQGLDSDEEDAFWANKMMTQLRKGASKFSKRRPSPSQGSDDRSNADISESDASTNHGWAAESPESPWMSLTVMRTDEKSCLTTMFQYRHPATLVLYESPPAIHPHKSLVVWPLGAGEILFADFELKTYFVRKMRSSATRTRHLSVKPHFSSCGNHLHIASLEAQLCEITHEFRLSSGDAKAAIPALRLHIVVSTYRLSGRKTTRSPPALVHRAKAFFGIHRALNVAELPFTLSWTDDAVFVTKRKADLHVLRIPLFKPTSPPSQPRVLVPRRSVFLPDNAPHRVVHFVPATTDGAPAFIVLGSEPNGPTNMSTLLATKTQQGALSPPICCLLDPERDLGEWISADEKPVPLAREAGNLEHRREKFDPEDDCEVTPYVRFT